MYVMNYSPNNNRERLHADVMRRVRYIYIMRLFCTPLVIEAALFAIFAVVICLTISIPSVVSNIAQLSYTTESISYIYKATIHTQLLVQVILGASIILGALILRNLYRNFRTERVQTI